MEQLSQKLKDGLMQVLKVPAPAVAPGNVLVQTFFSLVSAGTEGSTVKAARSSLLGEASGTLLHCCIKSEEPGESVNRQGDNPDASVCVGQHRSAVENWLSFLHQNKKSVISRRRTQTSADN